MRNGKIYLPPGNKEMSLDAPAMLMGKTKLLFISYVVISIKIND